MSTRQITALAKLTDKYSVAIVLASQLALEIAKLLAERDEMIALLEASERIYTRDDVRCFLARMKETK